MVQLISNPSIIKAAGNKEKIIKEFFGRVNSKTSEVSIAMMKSPQGWEEPGQCPEFNEYTIVFKGSLKIRTKKKSTLFLQAWELSLPLENGFNTVPLLKAGLNI